MPKRKSLPQTKWQQTRMAEPEAPPQVPDFGIQSLTPAKIQKLLAALLPFAKLGPDAYMVPENQRLMTAASLEAHHFRNAMEVFQDVTRIKPNQL